MKISARNCLQGKIKKLTTGTVNSEVIIELKGGEEICSIITNESAKNLGLKVGKKAFAVVKASNVMIATE